jgi:hypothetical protein
MVSSHAYRGTFACARAVALVRKKARPGPALPSAITRVNTHQYTQGELHEYLQAYA